VFIGMLGAQIAVDAWHGRQQRAAAEAERARRERDARAYEEQAGKLKELLNRQLQERAREMTGTAPGDLPEESAEDAVAAPLEGSE
jgi:hypothetical protein